MDGILKNLDQNGLIMKNKLNIVSICDGANVSGFVAKKLGINQVAFIDKNLIQFQSLIGNSKAMELLEDWRQINDQIDIAYFRQPKLQLSPIRESEYDKYYFKELLRFMDIKKPKWAVWEMHPDLIQSWQGRVFREIIGNITSIGYGVSWRVFDSSLFQSPIKSEKLILVCHLGSWEQTRSVLFEEESSLGNFEIKERDAQKSPSIPEDNRAIEVTPEMILMANNLPKNYLSKIPKEKRAKVAKNASNALLVEFILSRIRLASSGL